MKTHTPDLGVIADMASPELLLTLAKSGNMAARDAGLAKVAGCHEALAGYEFKRVLGEEKWLRMRDRVRDLGIAFENIQRIGKTELGKSVDWDELLAAVGGAQ